LRSGDFCISVSSGGVSPSKAQGIRDYVKTVLPPALSGDNKTAAGKVYLVGAGPGSADNLTLKALKLLNTFNVALIDLSVGEDVKNLLPKNCLKIDVSKKKGFHSFSQEEINRMLSEYASKGFTIGRLKGGDPSIFGRLYEEASYLAEQNIEVEIVNGVSSVTSGMLSAGIVPTLRGAASSFTVVSAHLKGMLFNDGWIPSIKEGNTVIALMAHSFADKISESAIKFGISPDTPAAFVSKIDTPEQVTVLGTIERLGDMSKKCERPAVLIIGSVVKNTLPFYHGRRITA
jgi:uroporphyrin-III C-methyltransferase/precorrin-2 dehydrogenase/sirohydrochlorin ferrochelatase